MATARVSEEEFDYQLLFKPPENHPQDEVNLIEKYLKQFAAKELLGEAYVRDYMQDQKRRNCRPATMRGNVATLMVFLSYLKQERGRTSLETIARDDVSSFIEHEQDRPGAALQVKQVLVFDEVLGQFFWPGAHPLSSGYDTLRFYPAASDSAGFDSQDGGDDWIVDLRPRRLHG